MLPLFTYKRMVELFGLKVLHPRWFLTERFALINCDSSMYSALYCNRYGYMDGGALQNVFQ